MMRGYCCNWVVVVWLSILAGVFSGCGSSKGSPADQDVAAGNIAVIRAEAEELDTNVLLARNQIKYIEEKIADLTKTQDKLEASIEEIEHTLKAMESNLPVVPLKEQETGGLGTVIAWILIVFLLAIIIPFLIYRFMSIKKEAEHYWSDEIEEYPQTGVTEETVVVAETVSEPAPEGETAQGEGDTSQQHSEAEVDEAIDAEVAVEEDRDGEEALEEGDASVDAFEEDGEEGEAYEDEMSETDLYDEEDVEETTETDGSPKSGSRSRGRRRRKRK